MTVDQSRRERIRPTKIYIDKESVDDALTARILERLGWQLTSPQVQVLEDSKDPLSEQVLGRSSSIGDSAQRMTEGKRQLILRRHKGSWLKACPGTQGHVCCNLWIVNPGEGCPFDCTYCYLQSYLRRNPTLKLYTNTNEMLAELETRALAEPGRLFRVGTGEVIDSLVWDQLTDSTLELVPFFARIPNLTLELKSKDDFVDNLVQLRNEHEGKTVCSWSVNAQAVTERDERDTATLSERIEAAGRVVDAGYRVGFHFDPLIHFDGWEEGYLETIRRIFSAIDSTRVAWVSISSLRYKPDLQQTMVERFPESRLPFGEQFVASDNKLRYLQPLRFRMLRFVWDQLKEVRAEMPVYMCMESSAAWRNISGGPPVAGSELVEIFSRKGKLLREEAIVGA